MENRYRKEATPGHLAAFSVSKISGQKSIMLPAHSIWRLSRTCCRVIVLGILSRPRGGIFRFVARPAQV